MVNQEPFTYLSGLQGKGMRLDLAMVRRVLGKMHHPDKMYPSILVGGTNGKGSICAMASSILAAAGYRVGLYTSPHLVDVRERFRCDGHMISQQEMADSIHAVRRYAGDSLTYFEFLTVLAFLFFSIRKVDIAVLEVGMGGRLDATNVIDPLVSVISNISLEHCAYLGKRLSQIAREKAGIIRRNGICLTGATQKPVLDVLDHVCRIRQATCHRIGRDIRIRAGSSTSSFSYRGLGKRYDRLVCPLLGRHQLYNAALALAIMEFLPESLIVDEQAVRLGLERAHWPGRMEVLQEHPHIVLDGAHNPAGMSVLCRALKETFSYRRLLVLCGILTDKHYKGMLRHIAGMADLLILSRPATERALAPKAMIATAREYCRDVQIQDDPEEAMKMALNIADPEDLICVTGSLYLVGQIKAAFGWNKNSDY